MVSGNRVANSADSLGSELMKEGLTPLTISLVTETSFFTLGELDKFFQKPVTMIDLGVFARQMYSLTRTGVPLSSALKNLADSLENKTLSQAVYGMIEQIESGKDIASAMESYPKVFPGIFIGIVKVGQSSGRISEAFLSINQFLELESNSVRNVKSALRYPTFVMIGMIAAIVIINIFVIPVFAHMYADTKLTLPFATKLLISSSHFFTKYWLHLLGFTLISFVLLRNYIRTEKGHYQKDRLLLKLPIIGKLLKGVIIQRFAQTFSMTNQSGIPVIEGLKLVARAVDNDFAKKRIDIMRESIEHGNNLTQAAVAANLFNSLELQMIGVSEQTGELSIMLDQIAEYYRRETDYNVKRLNDLIEPIIITFMSVLVLILALAVYMPVWNMVKLTK